MIFNCYISISPLQNNGNVKRDILANINCDSEALDKFLRGIAELPEWRPLPLLHTDFESLRNEATLRGYLGDLHLSEYAEEFCVFARCQEWWCKLPLFNDEEMRIWFGVDKPGHLIRFRTALREQVEAVVEGQQQKQQSANQQSIRYGNRMDVSVPVELLKRRRYASTTEEEDEILVLFQGALAKLRISSRDICIAAEEKEKETNLHRHALRELLYVYQDGEDLTRFGYQMIDSSCWEFQTASIVTTAKAVLIIAHRFGFE